MEFANEFIMDKGLRWGAAPVCRRLSRGYPEYFFYHDSHGTDWLSRVCVYASPTSSATVMDYSIRLGAGEGGFESKYKSSRGATGELCRLCRDVVSERDEIRFIWVYGGWIYLIFDPTDSPAEWEQKRGQGTEGNRKGVRSRFFMGTIMFHAGVACLRGWSGLRGA